MLGPSIGHLIIKGYRIWPQAKRSWPLAEAMGSVGVGVGERQFPELLLPLSRAFAFIFIKPDNKALISCVHLKQKMGKY